jgi:4-amino-4-deoxy-L-arabinose transferase-like glycosyltransferase
MHQGGSALLNRANAVTAVAADLDSNGAAKAALIFAGAFLIYFLTRSPGLDEYDSVQFALGIGEFNLWKHQPHPPGYPLYIFLSWLPTRFFGWSPEFSLQFMSCIGGALFVAAWFCIIHTQFGERFAWLLAATLAITPVVWMTSTRALSDSLAAGLLSVELFCALLFQEKGAAKQLIAAAVFAAAAASARPQLLPVALVILVTALFHRRAAAKLWLTGAAIFLVACLLWLVPTRFYPAQFLAGERIQASCTRNGCGVSVSQRCSSAAAI